MSLLGKKVLADVKDLEMRSSGLPKWTLDPMASVLIRDTKKRDKERKEGLSEDKARDWNGGVSNQGMPGATTTMGKRLLREDPPLEPLDEGNPADTLIADSFLLM